MKNKINYTFSSSPLGDMVMGATTDGICFLEWTDRGGIERILKRVEKRYKLPLDESETKFTSQLKQELQEYFKNKREYFTVPLDIKGTPFENNTWHKLLEIPFGKLRTYGDIARELENPGASRAVGRANGANYMSIIIPCHRVVEAGGGLRGYGGGLWRKKYLLNLESNLLNLKN